MCSSSSSSLSFWPSPSHLIVLHSSHVFPLLPTRYHHVSVLLYCWHSYSTRISSGLWFGAMNYLVHAFMYFYFAMTQINATTKAMVRPFAMCLTLLQLLQMVVGIAVTVASAVYSVEAKDGCHGNSTNTVLGLLMYFSYFVLFGHLFRQRYCVPQTKGKGVKKD